jgi:hypothetical protein
MFWGPGRAVGEAGGRFDQEMLLIEWVFYRKPLKTGGKPQKPTQLRPFFGEIGGWTEN